MRQRPRADHGLREASFNIGAVHVVFGIAAVFTGYPQAASLALAIGSLFLGHALNHRGVWIVAGIASLFFLGVGGWLDFEGWRFLSPRGPLGLSGSP